MPPGAPKLKVTDVKDELSAQWNQMSRAEKIEATRDYLAELEELRDNKKFVKHNTEKSAHEDAQKTLAAVQVTVCFVERGGLVVAEGDGVRQYPREVPRERPVSAHRGTGGESLNIRGRNQPSIYTCTEPVM